MNRLVTIHASSTTALVQQLKSLKISPISTVLFAVSSNIDENGLADVVSHLSSSSKTNIGCVTAPSSSRTRTLSCSVAAFDSASVVPFRSAIQGKPKIALGRWQRPGQPKGSSAFQSESFERFLHHKGDLDGLWGTSETENLVHDKDSVPDVLRDIRGAIDGVIYFSDDAPEGLTASLDQYHPNVPKLGLIGASTPFLTGLHQTLLQGEDTFEDGALGLALLRQPTLGPIHQMHGFMGLKPISQTYSVTSGASNLIYSIDGKNPTKEALAAYSATDQVGDKTGMKVKDMYLGVLGWEEELYQKVYRITSGDPSRGTLALDAEIGPPEGSLVQFLHHSPSFDEPAVTSQHTIRFSAVSAATELGLDAHSTTDPSWLIDGTFSAYSENGILMNPVSPSTKLQTWKSSVPGSWGSLGW